MRTQHATIGRITITSDNKGGIGPALLAFCIHLVIVVREKPAAGMLLLSALVAELHPLIHSVMREVDCWHFTLHRPPGSVQVGRRTDARSPPCARGSELPFGQAAMNRLP